LALFVCQYTYTLIKALLGFARHIPLAPVTTTTFPFRLKRSRREAVFGTGTMMTSFSERQMNIELEFYVLNGGKINSLN
jgi:hypothetical protein